MNLSLIWALVYSCKLSGLQKCLVFCWARISRSHWRWFEEYNLRNHLFICLVFLLILYIIKVKSGISILKVSNVSGQMFPVMKSSSNSNSNSMVQVWQIKWNIYMNYQWVYCFFSEKLWNFLNCSQRRTRMIKMILIILSIIHFNDAQSSGQRMVFHNGKWKFSGKIREIIISFEKDWIF